MGGGAWWAAVHGVSKSRTRLKCLHFHFLLSCIGEGNGNPLQCSCLKNPRDGGAWWAPIYGVTQSRTRLKPLSSRSSSTVSLGDVTITSKMTLFLLFFCCTVLLNFLKWNLELSQFFNEQFLFMDRCLMHFVAGWRQGSAMSSFWWHNSINLIHIHTHAHAHTCSLLVLFQWRTMMSTGAIFLFCFLFLFHIR